MNKKIVFLASYPDSLINFRFQLIQEFIKKDFQVVAIAPENKKVRETLEGVGVKFIALPLKRNGLNPFLDLALVVKLYRILRYERPERIFSYTIKPVIYGSVSAWLAGIPKIYSMITGTGYVFLNNSLKNKCVGFIAKKMFRCALRLNTFVFFQNPDNRAFFLEQHLISREQKTCVINGSGVDCDYFAPTPLPKTATFLMVARLLKDKGIYEYVEAAKKIQIHYPGTPCYLVGWVDTNPNAIKESELQAWVQESSVQYLGKLSDVRPAICNASVYVLPSYHEGTPRTVLEAMAMKRPIITTDTPGCRETVVPSSNGFLVPVKDSDALYKAMVYFIENPEAIEKMGEASRKIALEKFDVHKVNAGILKAMGIE